MLHKFSEWAMIIGVILFACVIMFITSLYTFSGSEDDKLKYAGMNALYTLPAAIGAMGASFVVYKIIKKPKNV
jgi:hypothetical protein